MEAEPRSQFVDLGPLRLHYLRWPAQEPRGQALLLHALGWNARAWWKIAPLLAERGIGCLAPDLRGHGLSDRPPEGYDYTTMAADVGALAGALGLESPLLVGHSWGAVLALELASGGKLAPCGAVFLDGAIGQLNTLPGANEDLFLQAMEPHNREGVAREAFLERLMDPARPYPLPPHEAHIILASYEEGRDGRLWPRVSRERYRAVLRSVWNHPTYERFSRVRCPVLMLPVEPPEPRDLGANAHLWLNHEGVKVARARIRKLEIHWLRDTPHDWMLLQRAQEIARVMLDFIAGKGLFLER